MEIKVGDKLRDVANSIYEIVAIFNRKGDFFFVMLLGEGFWTLSKNYVEENFELIEEQKVNAKVEVGQKWVGVANSLNAGQIIEVAGVSERNNQKAVMLWDEKGGYFFVYYEKRFLEQFVPYKDEPKVGETWKFKHSDAYYKIISVLEEEGKIVVFISKNKLPIAKLLEEFVANYEKVNK